ncbi:glycosyltransferase [Candidatus Saccharibacteria bacterium]|nr:glycosyltransferase [Candidatus Saccharibacteria bacterium]
MRIAVFTDVFLEVPGGIPSSISAQKESLKKLGHEVTIFAPGFAADDTDVKIVPTHKFLRVNGALLSKRPEKVMEAVLAEYPKFDFDIVHVHYEASCSIAGMKLARKFDKPLVQTMHGREDMAVKVNIPHPVKTVVGCLLCYLHGRYVPHPVKVKRDKDLADTIATAKMWTLMVNHANYADKVITPSEHFARRLKKYGVKKPITVVSNGVADEMVADVDKRVRKVGGDLVRKLEKGDRLRIFWNSRLSYEKRIMPFLEALTLMKTPYFFSTCGDGNALESAKKFVKKHGMEEKVVFYGRVPHEEVLDKMLGQHISATVSYGFDTQGLTLLEAEAMGLPVFFCDPDMKESVPENGFVMSGGPSPREMARALDEISRNPAKIRAMSEVMLKHRKEILQSTQMEKLLAVYNSFSE